MFKSKQIKPLILLGSLGLFSSLSHAAPPFVQGQLAVYATPYELIEHEVIKWLPNAGISLVSVESGKEWGSYKNSAKRGIGLALIV